MENESTDHSFMVVSARKRGRPRAKDPSTTVLTRLPNSYYDRLTKIAHRHGISMSSVVRNIVILRLRDL